ncbi:MAG: radical SAM protein [Alistipes sp.]|nr:radical SAM protein [Alistipes sp.]
MSWLADNNITQYKFEEYNVFYSPIGRCYVVATEEQFFEFISKGLYKEIFSLLADYVPIDQQRKVRTPKDYTLLTVLPNNMCNFSCSYCYSAMGRNKDQLSPSILKKAIDYFFESKDDKFDRPLTISFMGGGEPMLSWDVVKFGVLYARQLSISKNIKLNIRIITNGSILNDEHLQFIKEQHIDVSVSFEIIPEIQALQRKHNEIVTANINRLISFGIPVQLNATITPINVNRITEMVEIVNRDYSAVKNIMFEPVVAETMFATPEDMRQFYQQYIEGFIQGRILADKYNISLTSFAYLRTIFPLERACPGEFCITAKGDITGCYCVDSEMMPLFDMTKYGSINDNIIFDESKYRNLINNNVYSKPECADCEVRWNCGGGCFHQYNTYGKPYRDEACKFTKDFVKRIVEYKVNRMLQYNNKRDTNQPIYFKEEL